jgi:general nucleoside transport system permease protein
VRLRRVFISVLAPLFALALAILISSLALFLIHENPLTAFRQMIDFGVQPDSLVFAVNSAVPLFLSGLAVAIGFRMGLFNIGVEGQYTLAALLAAYVGASVHLPGPIHVILILLVAMAVGALWASIAGVLKVWRGVHEVISTIMLNAIAISGLTPYLLSRYLQARPASLIIKTKDIPKSGLLPSLTTVRGIDLFGFLPIAVLVGIGFYVLVWRTRLGYDLRASGYNPDAARAAGVNPKAMILKTMLLSGAIAGLVGMPDLLGFFHRYGIDFTPQLGFTGIAVALVGRNHPVGIGLAALLFGFLDRSSQILDFEAIPKEIVIIMTGVIVLTVVIAYEVVRRIVQAQEVKAAAEVLKRGSEGAGAEVTA